MVDEEGTENQEIPVDKEKVAAEHLRSVLNYAKEEYICEVYVEPKLDDDYKEGSPARDLSTIDIREVARDLLQSSCSNCSPKLTIDEELREDIATDLNEVILRPSQLSGSKIDLITLSLLPAVAIDVKSGAICGYGIAQLVAYGKNYAKRSKIFRGYAQNVETFQHIFKMINKTMK